MTCTETHSGDMTELDFVLALHTRHRRNPACCGPLLMLELTPWRVFTIEQIIDSQKAADLLWEGHHPNISFGTAFTLCAAHWLDLDALLWLRSAQKRRSDWHSEADHLFTDICSTAVWDPKEIANMFRWQTPRLT